MLSIQSNYNYFLKGNLALLKKLNYQNGNSITSLSSRIANPKGFYQTLHLSKKNLSVYSFQGNTTSSLLLKNSLILNSNVVYTQQKLYGNSTVTIPKVDSNISNNIDNKDNNKNNNNKKLPLKGKNTTTFFSKINKKGLKSKVDKEGHLKSQNTLSQNIYRNSASITATATTPTTSTTSIPFYSDASFEDTECGLTDKLIEYYYRRRQIQTKYNSRNLRKTFVYISPKGKSKSRSKAMSSMNKTTTITATTTTAPTTTNTTMMSRPGSENDKKDKELMVLLGWWNSHPKHLSKYVKLYHEMGHPVLAHISPTSLMLAPKLLNKKNERLMEELYQFWQKAPQNKKPRIMFHTFSDNGSYVFAHFTYVAQRKLKQLKGKVDKQRELLTTIYQKLILASSSSSTSLELKKLKDQFVKSGFELKPTQSKPLPYAQSSSFTKTLPSATTTSLSERKIVSSVASYSSTTTSSSSTTTVINGMPTMSSSEISNLITKLKMAEKDYNDYQSFYYCMEAAIMDSGPSLLTQSVITRGITAGITSMKCMRYFGIKHTHHSSKLSKMIYYFYHWYVKHPSIAKYLIQVYYPAFRNVPRHMAYMFMYGNGDKVICPDLIEPYIYNLQKGGLLVRRAYFEGSGHVMHFVVHRDKYVCEVKKFIGDIREHSRIEEKSGVRIIYDKITGRILDNEKILIPDKRHRSRSVWENAKANEEHFRFLGIMPNNFSKYE